MINLNDRVALMMSRAHAERLALVAEAEEIAARWADLADTTDQILPRQGWEQSALELRKAGLSGPASAVVAGWRLGEM
ncbi:MAG: hypothetical protein EPO51_12125 [Phenylobacterium sp.]|uniref:hypothetical protein n=1 Tax=Phenylobacterium sp. TaxID=1871053 RepID=UPI00120B5BA3|nr:hypothetical protein [Phenylobacterium sp.]TAJ71860.1 MAG: hypothetical protein EPO51_12125 [Phenylobacterium sp.]